MEVEIDCVYCFYFHHSKSFLTACVFAIIPQCPERERQGPASVSGNLGLGLNQQERLHGLAVLRDLRATETRSRWMVRVGEAAN